VCDILDILNTMLTWRCTKHVTSGYGKCHNIRENEIGESYTILSKPPQCPFEGGFSVLLL
jgi:hypothetical protein